MIGARYLLDLSEAETAEALELPTGTVKSRTSRALGRLRVALAELDGGRAMADASLPLPDGDLEAALRGLAPAVAWPTADRGPGRPTSRRPSVRGSRRVARRRAPATGRRPVGGAARAGPGGRHAGRWCSRWSRSWRSPRSPARSGSGCRPADHPRRGPPVEPAAEPRPSRSPRRARPAASMGLGEPRRSWPSSTTAPASTCDGRPIPSVGPPDAAYIDDAKGGQVTLVWAARPELPATLEPGVGLLLSQFRGTVDDGFFNKAIDGGTTVEPVPVGGRAGYWLSGDPHVFFWEGPDGFVDDTRRWVGDTLLWSDGDDHVPARDVPRSRRGDPPGRNAGLRADRRTFRQQSNANQHNALRRRWSSSTRSRIASGSRARCHGHSRRPAASLSSSGAAARAALTA